MQEFAVDTAFGRITGLRNGALQPGQPRVLALHGWLDNAASFAPLASCLPGLHWAAPDLPGHGRSAHLPPSADYTVVSSARAALAVADALGWARFTLVGHSLGAAVASTLAAAAPARVEQLVLIEAVGALTQAAEHTAQRMRESFDAQATPARPLRVFADVATAVRARMQANDLTETTARGLVERGIAPVEGGFVWRSDVRLTRPTALRMTESQARDLIAAVECPTCVIYAEPSQPYFPEPLRSERAALLRDAQVHRLPGSHHLHMEDAATVAALIGRFVLRDVPVASLV